MMQKLKLLGLTEYEIQAYLAVLGHKGLSGGDIARKGNIPQGKVYWALHKLVERGFVQVVGVKPQLFHAIAPEEALDTLVQQKITDLSELKKDLLTDIKKREPVKDTDITEKIQVLSGRKTVDTLITHFFKNAKKEIRFLFPYEERSYDFVQLFRNALLKGKKVRFLVTKKDKKNIAWIKQDAETGVDIRYLPVDEIRLQIMDESEARLTVVDPKDRRERTTTYFQKTEIVKHLASYFDVLWEKGEKIT